MLVDPLTADQWVLQLITPVTLATLSMEAAPGLVEVMECGVGLLQLVSVSGMNFVLFVCSVYRLPYS